MQRSPVSYCLLERKSAFQYMLLEHHEAQHLAAALERKPDDPEQWQQLLAER